MVTYTIAAAAGCTQVQATTSVTITPLPTANISYAGTPFCNTLTTGAVTLTGTNAYTGGTYSSTAGLSINPTTGEINPIASAAGTYLVTYTTPQAGGCAAVTATASVTITALPTANITYAGTPFCKSLTASAVTLTGANAYTGGSYSSTAGLSINSTTGEINPSASTAATYLITYTLAPAGGCAQVQATASVTITPLPTATISGTTALCQGASAPTVTFTGSNGTAPYTFTYQINAGPNQTVSTLSANSVSVSQPTQAAGLFTYTLLSVSDVNCSQNQNSDISITVYALPTDVALAGGGFSFCGAPVSVSLVTSQSGVSYQLKRNNVNLGNPLEGTGGSLSFTGLTQGGTYTVVANTIIGSCTRTLSGEITIQTRTAPTVYNLTGGGASCSGSPVGISLSNSQIGVTYLLKRGATHVASVAGTGNAFWFPAQNTPGNYTVTAQSPCGELAMNNTVSITAVVAPNTYAVTGGGSSCGTALPVGLSNSQNGIQYQLLRDNQPVGSSISGTGAALTLGSHSTAGNYTVTASRAGQCPTPMSGNVSITTLPTPALFTVTGGGVACPGGVEIGLSGSQSGIQYQLKRGSTPVSTLAGTGASLSFGPQSIAGNYTIEALGGGTCSRIMSGTAGVTPAGPLPTPYTMTGGGAFCNNIAVGIGLSDSQKSFYYQLQRNTAGGFVNVGMSVQGTGTALSLGSHSAIGEYRVVVISPCMTEMAHRKFITACNAKVASEESVVQGILAQVTPNPVSHTLHLKISEAKGQTVQVNLTDASGRVLLQRNFVPQTHQHQEAFDVSNLNNGMYFMQVKTTGKRATLKVIKIN